MHQFTNPTGIKIGFRHCGAGIVCIFVLFLFFGCAKESEKTRQLRLTAEGGDATAQLQLGVAYGSEGKPLPGIPRDEQKAVFWLRKAADQGNATAQCMLGIDYLDGSGVPEDASEAVKWFRLSADQGNAPGQVCLGSMYASGEGVPKDSAKALTLFRLAAEQGNALGQLNLGSMYATGQGVPKDGAEGARWLRKAAEQGNANAQRNLGAMYFNGVGVPKDISEATKWIRLAAEQGDAEAQRDMVTVSKPQPLQIDAVRLVYEYEANEIRADSAYKGKTASVSGYVAVVGKDILNDPYVTLARGDGQLGQVQCMLSADAVAQASTLNPGQAVTLTGQIDGKMMNVILRDCSFSLK
jgi:hypothetical protein